MQSYKMTLAAVLITMVPCSWVPAGGPVTWGFEFETWGEDVYWDSPSAVGTSAGRYFAVYDLTQAWVKTILGWTDVTDLVPDKYRHKEANVIGPAPVVFFEDELAFPEPPEDPIVSAYITAGLDADGFGYLSGTDIYLGTYVFKIQAIAIMGDFTVLPTCRADIAGSGEAPDGYVDVLDLLCILADWGACPPVMPPNCPADITGPEGVPDGVVDVLDLLLCLAEWGECDR